ASARQGTRIQVSAAADVAGTAVSTAAPAAAQAATLASGLVSEVVSMNVFMARIVTTPSDLANACAVLSAGRDRHGVRKRPATRAGAQVLVFARRGALSIPSGRWRRRPTRRSNGTP